jgi:hypothetical protein
MRPGDGSGAPAPPAPPGALGGQHPYGW